MELLVDIQEAWPGQGPQPSLHMADVLIAGGGIAGSTLAILLGRQGFTIELFERGEFPKEKPCGEGLMPGGVAILRELGLLEASGGVPFYGVRYHFGGQTAEGLFPPSTSLPMTGRGQRRRHLDQVLFQAAAQTPGVSAHSGVQVDGPLVDSGKVVGLSVEGEPRRARLVVAADGVHSRILHALGFDAPVRRRRLGVRGHFRLAVNQEQSPWVDVFVSRGHELYVTPLPEREVLVAALVDTEALGGSLERAFQHWWKAEPALAARLEGAEQITSLLCSCPLAGRARFGSAPGVVLLGDAAGFVDPITGGGMTQALQTAKLLAQYARRGLEKTERWIWCFERERRTLLRDYRALTQMVLWLADHPTLAERLLSALRVSPALFSHLIGVSAGVRTFFRSESKFWRASGPVKEGPMGNVH